MTSRVVRMFCAQCNSYKRVKCPIVDGAETCPPCQDCGWYAWADHADWPQPGEVDVVESSERTPYDQGSWMKDIFSSQTRSEFGEFIQDFNRRQAEYLQKQFSIWREERQQEARSRGESIEADIGAMFREVWDIMEAPSE